MLRVTLLTDLGLNLKTGGAFSAQKMTTRNGQLMTRRGAANLGGSPCERESVQRQPGAQPLVGAARRAGDALAEKHLKSILRLVTPT